MGRSIVRSVCVYVKNLNLFTGRGPELPNLCPGQGVFKLVAEKAGAFAQRFHEIFDSSILARDIFDCDLIKNILTRYKK